MKDNARQNKFESNSPQNSPRLKVVKDVRITSSKQNQFRIKTSRSQSPNRLKDSSESNEKKTKNNQNLAQNEKSEQKKNKDTSKSRPNEENQDQNLKVKTIKVDKQSGSLERTGKKNVNFDASSQKNNDKKQKTIKTFITSKENGENRSNSDMNSMNNSEITSLKKIKTQNTIGDLNEIASKSRSKSKSKNKKDQISNKDNEETNDVLKGLLSINQTKSITNISIGKQKSKKGQTNNQLPSLFDKNMITTDNFSEKKGKSHAQINENGKRKKSEDKKKKKELEKQQQLKLKKKEIERIQKQKEDERLRQERIRRKEEETYFKNETERLKQEEDQVNEQNEFYHRRQISLFKKNRQKESWDYTIECNKGKLKLYDKLELDSYRYQLEQNLSFEKCQSIEEYLIKLQKAMENYQDIDNFHIKLSGEEKSQEELDWYHKLLISLKNIIYEKLQDLHIRILQVFHYIYPLFLVINYLKYTKQYSDSLQEEKRKELISQGFDLLLLIRSTAFEERQKVEIMQEYSELSLIKYMFWINPVGKGGLRIKPVEFTSTRVQIEVPRPYIQSKIVMTGFWLDIDYGIGGIYHFQLFELPQVPKVYKKFTMKFQKDNMDDIVQIHYPDNTVDDRDLSNFQNFVPIKISYKIPSYVVIPDTIQIGLWDDNLGWQTDQVQDIKFEEEQRILCFSSNKFSPFSLVQNRCVDFPYKSWSIRSIDVNKAKIDLVTKRFSMKFLVLPNQIEIVDINQYTMYEKMKGVKLPPHQLLQELKKCGINLMPSANDAMISDLLIKDKDCLDSALNDISKAVSGFYFKSTKWNKSVGVNQHLAYIKPNPEYDEFFIENFDKDWILTTWYSNKVGFYQTKEKDKEFSNKYLKNSETRSNFYLAVQQLGQTASELSERMKDTSCFEYWNTLKQFFHLTQIFGYTW